MRHQDKATIDQLIHVNKVSCDYHSRSFKFEMAKPDEIILT